MALAVGFLDLVTAAPESSGTEGVMVQNLKAPSVQFLKRRGEEDASRQLLLSVEERAFPVEVLERIVGGTEVNPPGKYPFMATSDPSTCSGSLIAPTVMLSAAH